MKTVYMVGGTMGIGKTTVCQLMKKKLVHSVFLDGDWCWDAHPFAVTEETKEMVMQNICFLLNQFLHCSCYQRIIFCWVLHEQEIIDAILSRIDRKACAVKAVSLVGSEKELRERLMKDVADGKRTEDIVERSAARLSCYEALNTVKVNTSNKSPEEIAEEIINL